MTESQLVDVLTEKLRKLRLSTPMDFDYYEDVLNYERALQKLVNHVLENRGEEWLKEELVFYD